MQTHTPTDTVKRKRVYATCPLSEIPVLASIGCNCTFEKRFWSKIKKTDGCWLWTGYKNHAGYGSINKGSSGTILAHVASWVIANNQPTNGRLICHRCDNPMCVNPSHLFAGTHLDNARDMVAKNRSAKGENASRVKLTSSDVIEIRKAYHSGEATQRRLASLYGVHWSCVFKIIHKKLWSHL